VDWPAVRSLIPGLLAGVLAGSLTARFVNAAFLKYFFLGFMALIIFQLVANLKPKGTRALPGTAAMTAMGLLMGVCSSWFGGGAAAIGVPFLTWCNMTTHRAIGTVAALGFPVAIAGTAGYAITGLGIEDLPEWSAGFVYLPAFVGISITSLVVAPYGARLAHRLSGPALRRIFAVFLISVGAKLAVSV
jgi:uncharacterized membrane protein YfcA